VLSIKDAVQNLKKFTPFPCSQNDCIHVLHHPSSLVRADTSCFLKNLSFRNKELRRPHLKIPFPTKGATREGAKVAKAPPLAKSKLRNKIKYRVFLIFFVSQSSEIAWFGQFMVLKVYYMSSSRLRHRKYIIKVTSIFSHFWSHSLSKILVALLFPTLHLCLKNSQWANSSLLPDVGVRTSFKG